MRANGRPSPGVSALCTDLIMIISDTCYGPLLISQYCCSVHDVTEITGRRNNADLLLVITRRREPDVASSMYKSGRSTEFWRPEHKSPRCCSSDFSPAKLRTLHKNASDCFDYDLWEERRPMAACKAFRKETPFITLILRRLLWLNFFFTVVSSTYLEPHVL